MPYVRYSREATSPHEYNTRGEHDLIYIGTHQYLIDL